MSIYDIRHGHVRHSYTVLQRHECQIAPIFLARFCTYIQWWHSCLETIYRHIHKSLMPVMCLVISDTPSLTPSTVHTPTGRCHTSAKRGRLVAEGLPSTLVEARAVRRA